MGYLSLHHESLTNIDETLFLSPSLTFNAELAQYIANAREELHDAFSSALEGSMLHTVIICMAKEDWRSDVDGQEEDYGKHLRWRASNETTVAGSTTSTSLEGTPLVFLLLNAMDLA